MQENPSHHLHSVSKIKKNKKQKNIYTHTHTLKTEESRVKQCKIESNSKKYVR